MALSTSGILTNTFAHELADVSNEFYSSANQIRTCILHFISEDTLQKNDYFNPLPFLDEANKRNELLSSWIDVLTNPIDSKSLNKSVVNCFEIIKENLLLWRPLLAKKNININFNKKDESILFNLSIAEIYLILNNFILNSVWFLDGIEKPLIEIKLSNINDEFVISMHNNGLPIDERYKENPFKIFDLKESSKERKINGKLEKTGTGIGLWIVKKIVDDNLGEIKFHDFNQKGFGFDIIFKNISNKETL